jgi:phosphoribosyl 1,2-cyclic phosphate phosphodiesterase
VHDIAYLTDCSGIPDSSLRMLGRLKVLVIDAVRFRPHATHFSVDEALEMVEILRPERAYLTHISHDLDHETVNEMLPENVELAYDGLRVTVE